MFLPEFFPVLLMVLTSDTADVMVSTARTAVISAGTAIPKAVRNPARSVLEVPLFAAASRIGLTAASSVADAVPFTLLRSTSDTWKRNVPPVESTVSPNSVMVRTVLAAFPAHRNAKKEQRVARRRIAVSIFSPLIRLVSGTVPSVVRPNAPSCSGNRLISAAPVASTCDAAAARPATIVPLKITLDTFVNVVMCFSSLSLHNRFLRCFVLVDDVTIARLPEERMRESLTVP